MNSSRPPGDAKFDVTVEPAAPGETVIDAVEDEEARRRRDAALASTFDPERIHHGKSEEEQIAEREAEARLIVDTAIAAGLTIAAVEAAQHHEHEGEADDISETAEDADESEGD
ncbi:MAG: hypothetical protein R3C25_02470 [Hyphomonadaceae bacterium]